MYHLKGFPYRNFYRNAKKSLDMGLSQQGVKKAAEYSLAESERNFYIPVDSFMNDEYDEE